MYDTQDVAFRIKQRARELKLPMKTLLEDCGLGINTISELSRGKKMAFISLALIADRLDCSVDYLLGRTDNPAVNR